jgi:protease-4
MPKEKVEALARGRVYSGKEALDVGLVDALGGFEQAMAEVRRMLPAALRERVEPAVVRLPRRHVPLLDPPTAGEAGRRAIDAVLSAVLSEGERALFALAASGERVAALWTGEAR